MSDWSEYSQEFVPVLTKVSELLSDKSLDSKDIHAQIKDILIKKCTDVRTSITAIHGDKASATGNFCLMWECKLREGLLDERIIRCIDWWRNLDMPVTSFISEFLWDVATCTLIAHWTQEDEKEKGKQEKAQAKGLYKRLTSFFV